MNVTGSWFPAGGSLPNVTLEVAERQVMPGETPSFSFIAYIEHEAPFIHENDPRILAN